MLEQPDRHLGRTPLLQALARGEWDATELLLAVGADPTVKDDEGRGAVGTRRAGGGGGEEEESDADSEPYDAPDALAAKLHAAAAEPQRALLLAKARLLVEASAAITRAAAAARDARKPEREVKRLVRTAAPMCLRARVEAQEALPSAAVAVVPTKPWVEEEGELLAVIKWVVGVEGDWGNGEAEEEEGVAGGGCVMMKREHVRELMGYLLPEWAWAPAGDGEGTVQG